MIALIASMLLATNATPAELIANCRTMIPREVELRGRIILRNKRGIEMAEYGYELVRALKGNSETETILKIDGARVENDGGSIKGTDVTWSDLTLDYLWWDKVSAEDESESVHGQTCAVLKIEKDGRTVKVWIDRKTGALMQAEELKDGKTCRRLWGSRIKKFGDRWMANVMEVETTGSGHRTKITVEELK